MRSSFTAELETDMDSLYESIEGLLERNDNRFYSTVRRNFGNTKKEDVFVQPEGYNIFLYEDGGVFSGDTDALRNDDRMLSVLSHVYNAKTIVGQLED